MLERTENATTGVTTGSGDVGARELPAMLDVQAVATLFDCSTRHVYRLSDSGRIPRPIKLGALVRWSREAIEHWIADGCPQCKRRGRQ